MWENWATNSSVTENRWWRNSVEWGSPPFSDNAWFFFLTVKSHLHRLPGYLGKMHEAMAIKRWFGTSWSGWWFGTWMDYDFPYIGNVIIPTDELIFFRGVGWNHQPENHWTWKISVEWGTLLFRSLLTFSWRETRLHRLSSYCSFGTSWMVLTEWLMYWSFKHHDGS